MVQLGLNEKPLEVCRGLEEPPKTFPKMKKIVATEWAIGPIYQS